MLAVAPREGMVVWCDIRDQVVAILLLLESTEGHLGAWDVLLWVLKVLKLVVC